MRKGYYMDGRRYEPVDVIRDWGLNFNLGNAVKYVARLGRKGTRGQVIEDLNKAIDYLIHEKEWLITEQNIEEAFAIDEAKQNKVYPSTAYGEMKGDTDEETNLY